jgi:IstB-like ATP binding protein
VGRVFGDDVVAAAMIDRLVHHAEVISLKGDSYRLKDRDLGRVPAAKINGQSTNGRSAAPVPRRDVRGVIRVESLGR